MIRNNRRISVVSTMHYCKLYFRSALFLAVLCVYLYNRVRHTGRLFGDIAQNPIILSIVWTVFAAEMILRMFPFRTESMGCQKQFRRNYIPKKDAPKPNLGSKKPVLAAAGAWIALNACIGGLYFTGVIDQGILLLICLAYSVCDMICILYFCPFQTWFLKNKCCTTCRIYNWDYVMMFTPLIFIPRVDMWSLLALAMILLVYWELQVWRHPERFLESCNDALACKNCQEKLCQHKRQLQSFQKKLFAECKAAEAQTQVCHKS